MRVSLEYEFSDEMKDVWDRYSAVITDVVRATESYRRACDASAPDVLSEHLIEKGPVHVTQHRDGVPFLIWNDGARFLVSQPMRWVAIATVRHSVYRHNRNSLVTEAWRALWQLKGSFLKLDSLKEAARRHIQPRTYVQTVVVAGDMDTSEIDLCPVVTDENVTIKEEEEA